jgi:hypothetical protein
MSNPGGAANDSRQDDVRSKEIHSWLGLFSEQLARQRVDREAIVRAEADVRAHCSDSGQAPAEAFGDARSYATTLSAELPHARLRIPMVKRIELILMCIGYALAFTSITSNAGQVSITLGVLLTIVIIIPLFWIFIPSSFALSLPRNPESPSRRSPDEHAWRTLVAVLGLFAVCAALWWSVDQEVFTVSKWIPFGLCVAFLTSGVTLSGRVRLPFRAGSAPRPRTAPPP